MVELITIDKEAFKIVETLSGYIIKAFPHGNRQVTECSNGEISEETYRMIRAIGA